MKKLLIAFVGIFALLAMAGGWFVSVGNSIVTKEESVKSAWSQVENVYQRRADLIPNLVNTVKGYAKHEQATLEGVIRARGEALGTGRSAMGSGVPNQEQLKKFQMAQQGLGDALSRLLVVVEKYPDLKANEGFRDLQAQLEGTENRIAVERRQFNEVAQSYNTYIRLFPQSLVASFRGFAAKPYFEAQAGANVAPKVEF